MCYSYCRATRLDNYVGIAGIFDILPIIVVISCPPGDPGVVWFPNPLADGDPVFPGGTAPVTRVSNRWREVVFDNEKNLAPASSAEK